MEVGSGTTAFKMMNQDHVKLDQFNGSNFACWQDKMLFLLTALKISYVLDSSLQPFPVPNEKDTDHIKADMKMNSDLNVKIPELFQVEAIIAKLPPTWNDYRKKLLHMTEELTLEKLGKHLRIEEENRIRDGFQPNSNINFMDHSGSKKTNFILKNGSNTANVVEDKSNEALVAMVSELQIVMITKLNMAVENGEQVLMGNGNSAKVLGKGTIELQFTSILLWRAAGGKEGDPPGRPPNSTFSYADIVGKQSLITSSSSIPLKSLSTYKGEPAIFFSDEENNVLAKPHALSLVAKCSYVRPSLDDIKAHMMKSEGLRMGAESSIVPVWVCFPNLPIHLFNDSAALQSIGSIFWKVLKIDGATKSISRPSAERICIEIDLLKQNPDRFWLGLGTQGRWQTVEYEKKFLFCTQCKKLGHEESSCGGGIKNRPNARSKRVDHKEKDVEQKAVDEGLQKITTKQWVVKQFAEKEKSGDAVDTDPTLLIQNNDQTEDTSNLNPQLEYQILNSLDAATDEGKVDGNLDQIKDLGESTIAERCTEISSFQFTKFGEPSLAGKSLPPNPKDLIMIDNDASSNLITEMSHKFDKVLDLNKIEYVLSEIKKKLLQMKSVEHLNVSKTSVVEDHSNAGPLFRNSNILSISEVKGLLENICVG
ncbi:hypothetical protein HHK36_019466 [Tetracentron sinense]|uniref:DUF4283 domain-containing protein n=1 Tax=Tetracentron sinense TaxID=13715 RepID=A0A835D9M7_TETSI|nr:hypothetical protein HHK36_019466 [Tetracentron sinense]